MKKAIVLIYGVLSYVAFLAAFLYAIGFVGNFAVPRSVDAGGPETPLGMALLINCLLLGAFAVQHSTMARIGFKKAITKFLPVEMERSTYVLATNAVLLLMYWQWRPMPGVIWSVQNQTLAGIIQSAFWLGWLVVLLSTFMINHFDLFGLRQVWLAATSKPYKHLSFRTTGFYGFVRHPILVGFMIAFWAAPTMTAGHLLFAVMTTGYMVIAVKMFEEKDLKTFHPARYEAYMEQVPAFVPRLTKASLDQTPIEE